MSKPHAFQLSYTVSPIDSRYESDAASARTYLREQMGWKTTDKIETTLLSELDLGPGTLEEKRKEAGRLVRAYIRDAFKTLEVHKTVGFAGSLLVSGLAPAINISISPE